jgi:DNA mismatch repair protein MutS
VLGYFIETTATHAEKMLSPPLSNRFIHRQTTANAGPVHHGRTVRLETRILNAGGRALEIEKRLFEALRGAVLSRRRAPWRSRSGLAEIDLQSAALADLAAARTGAAQRWMTAARFP